MDGALTLSGFVVGALVGLTGVGGGALMTPVLVVGFGIPPLVAVGTDLVFAAATKCLGVWVHARASQVDWRIVGLMALGSLPASLTTIQILEMGLAAHAGVTVWVEAVLGVALLLTATALLFQPRAAATGGTVDMGRRQAWGTVLGGGAIGVLVALTSVGAGALGVVLLGLLFPALPLARRVGTDLAHAVPLAAVSGLGHWQLGHVDLYLLAALLLGSLPGIWLGARLSRRLPERLTRPLLATLLTAIGIKLIA